MQLQFPDERRGGERLYAEKNDIRFHAVRLKFQSWEEGETFREGPGIGVVQSEPFAVVFERMEGSGGDHPGLSHAATIHFAESPGPLDDFPGTTKDRTDGGTEAFGKTNANRIEEVSVIPLRYARGHGGIPQACSIKV